MRVVKLLLVLTLYITVCSCERDRDRVKAGENKIEGSWDFVSLEYTDSEGKAVVVPSNDPNNPPSDILTFIQADRTGILRSGETTHLFKYLYGDQTCELTFDNRGSLPIEVTSVPDESIGKVYIFDVTFTSDHKTVEFHSKSARLTVSNETITDVKYVLTRL